MKEAPSAMSQRRAALPARFQAGRLVTQHRCAWLPCFQRTACRGDAAFLVAEGGALDLVKGESARSALGVRLQRRRGDATPAWALLQELMAALGYRRPPRPPPR
jgi:hypothetical protein